MVLNYYFAQHLKKICTYTKAMGGEKLYYKNVRNWSWLIHTSVHFLNCYAYKFPLKYQLDNFHKSSKPNNYKPNILNFTGDMHLQI